MTMRIAFAATLAGVLAAAALALSADRVRGVDEKIPGPDPWAGLTDEEKQAFVDAARRTIVSWPTSSRTNAIPGPSPVS